MAVLTLQARVRLLQPPHHLVVVPTCAVFGLKPRSSGSLRPSGVLKRTGDLQERKRWRRPVMRYIGPP